MDDSKEEYSQEYLDKQTATRQWIEELIDEQIGEDLSESLRDGIILCKLISALCPTLEITVITSTPHKYRIMENISAFLEACTRLGFTYTELFIPPDLFEKKNMNKVLDTIKKIADYAATYDFPKWKGSTTQFSRTERRSIISGGDTTKVLPPKGSLPPKKPVLPASTSNVRSLPLLSPSTNGKPSAKPARSTNAISGSKEISKTPVRTALTLSKDAPQKTSENTTDDQPDTPKPSKPPPTWDALISSSDTVNPPEPEKGKPVMPIQEITPREEIVYNEVSLPPPARPAPPVVQPPSFQPSTPPRTFEPPVPAKAHPKPLPPTPTEPTRVVHQKSISSGNLNTLASSSGHPKTQNHTTPFSTSPPNVSKMSSFQRVQQGLYPDEDSQKNAIKRAHQLSSSANLPSSPSSRTSTSTSTHAPSSSPSLASSPLASSSTSTSADEPASHKARPSGLTQSLRSTEAKDPDESRPEHRSERKSDRSDPSGSKSERSDRSIRKSAEHSERKADRPERSERSERSESDRQPLPEKLRALADSFGDGGHSKATQDLESQLKQTTDIQEREKLQRKISLLVSETRLAEYMTLLPRNKDTLNNSGAFPTPPPSLANSTASLSDSGSLYKSLSPSLSSSTSSALRDALHNSSSSALSMSSASSHREALTNSGTLPKSHKHGSTQTSKHSKKSSLTSSSDLSSAPSSRASSPPSRSTSPPSRSSPPPRSSTDKKHHKKRERNSLPTNLPNQSPSSSRASPPHKSPPSSSISSSDISSDSSAPRGKSKRSGNRHSLAFPPPLPPLLSSLKDGKRGHDVSTSVSDSDYSSSSSLSSAPSAPSSTLSSSLRRSQNTATSPPSSISPLNSSATFAQPIATSSAATQTARDAHAQTAALSRSLPVRGIKSPKKARKPLTADTFSNPERPPPRPHSERGSVKYASLSRVSAMLLSDEDTMETQVQRLDELLRSTTDGSSMLHLASRHNYIKVVAFLLQCGEDPNAQDKSGKTPLHVAAALGNREIIDLLISAGAQINTRDDLGATPLQRAAEHNQSSVVKKIVAVPGVKIDTTRNQDGWTPLYTSSHQGNYDNVSMLLTYHADPNVQNSEGWTPLHAACHQGHYKVVKLLAKAGANLNVLSKQGTTPLFHAVEKDQLDIAKLLGELGASLDLSKEFGWKPLHIAIYKGCHESTSWLVAKGAKLNEIVRDTNLKGYTPLHILVSSDWLSESSKKNLEVLLKSGANILTRDDSGATPLHLATYWDNVDAVKIIIKYFKEDDVIFEVTDKNGETAADIAAWYGNLQVLKLLPKNSTKLVKNNPQTTGKMLPPLPPPLPPALLSIAPSRDYIGQQ